MEAIVRQITSMPLWHILLIVGEAILLVVVIILWRKYVKDSFIKKLRRIVEDPELADELIVSKYSRITLMRKSSQIEKFAEKEDASIIKLIGMDKIWVDELLRTKRKKDFLRVLKYAPEEGLFECFQISLKKKRFMSLLMKYLEASSDTFQIRHIALSGDGEPFDGKAAWEKLEDKMPEIREMMGAPEWRSRYFSIKILIHDVDDRSERAVWDAFDDSNSMVRKTLAREYVSEDSERLYGKLNRLFLKDPVFEVRETAWKRIQDDFADFHSFDAGELGEDDVFHLLELLRPNVKEDEDFALQYLESENLELRYAAAQYLDANGVLERHCLGVDLGDKKALVRISRLLSKAVEVNVLGFLSAVEKADDAAPLLICAQILLEHGDRDLITTMAKKVFRISRDDGQPSELYTMTLGCVSKRGNDDALQHLNHELKEREDKSTFMTLLLRHVPVRGDVIFMDTLIAFLNNPEFELKDELRQVLRKMSTGRILTEVFTILKAETGVYPQTVRSEALKLLAEMDMHYCLQSILEALPAMPAEESHALLEVLSEYPRDVFIEKVKNLLKNVDARVRGSIISVLPVTEEKAFVKPIREGLKDADPDVRVASVWALVHYKDMQSVEDAVAMLRDPVDRVREQAALAAGSFGSKNVFKGLQAVMNDENEILPVREASIRGLGFSDSPDVIDMLCDRLSVEEDKTELIIRILAKKTDPKEIRRIIENFKDGVPHVRERITATFIRMGEEGEELLADLLREDIASLNPYIVEILEATGYVEGHVRRLKNKDREVRRNAAAFLSMVGTISAFRGIVLAARDPDEEVRLQVTKALEKLETKEGEEILKALESDPDRRIRKYTHWALERLKAKAL